MEDSMGRPGGRSIVSVVRTGVAFSLAVFGSVGVAYAQDVVTTTSGDRLVGEISGSKRTFCHSRPLIRMLDFKIEWEDVAALESNEDYTDPALPNKDGWSNAFGFKFEAARALPLRASIDELDPGRPTTRIQRRHLGRRAVGRWPHDHEASRLCAGDPDDGNRGHDAMIGAGHDHTTRVSC
jgi:hypothetical protein